MSFLVRRLIANKGIRSLTASDAGTAKITMMNVFSTKPQNGPPAVRTIQKSFGLSDDEKISRHTFEKYGRDIRSLLDKLDRTEAFLSYAGFMQIADIIKLDKYPEDGGNTYTIQELADVLQETPKDTAIYYGNCFTRPIFRAIDTNGDGFLSREEWIDYLKLRNTYERDEQAMRSFDRIDSNKDGRISMEEFVGFQIKFWGSGGTDEDVRDFYGTYY